jgi:hypothetical protein
MAAEEPFQIVWASEAWLRLCEFDRSAQVLGRTLDLIHGPMTDRSHVESLMASIRCGQPTAVSLTNHTRSGKAFRHTLRVEPLKDSRGNVQCFQATSANVEEIGQSGGDGSGGVADHGLSSTDLAGIPRPLPMKRSISGDPAAPSGPGAGSAGLSGAGRSGPVVGSISRGTPRSASMDEMDLPISDMLDLFDAQGRSPVPGSPRIPSRAPSSAPSAQQQSTALSTSSSSVLEHP